MIERETEPWNDFWTTCVEHFANSIHGETFTVEVSITRTYLLKPERRRFRQRLGYNAATGTPGHRIAQYAQGQETRTGGSEKWCTG